MAMQRFLIANLKSGLVTNPDPWLIMDDAWFRLENVHAWRGKVLKRIGSREMDTSQAAGERQLFTRLRIKLGTTNGAGAFGPVTVPGAIVNTNGQIFSCGDEIYTVAVAGSPATMLSTGTGIPTYNTTAPNAGQFTLANGPLVQDVFFYPSFPVMALPSYENIAINAETLVAFDTQFVYTYTTGAGWGILGPTPPAANSGLWTGSDSDFHWTTNWRGTSGAEYLFFVVNGVVADQLQYYNGTNWTKIAPVYDSGAGLVIRTAKIVTPFKGRLLLMNTIEQQTAGADLNFVNRVRYSQIGDPTVAATSWDETVVGRGGFIDITTREAIVSCEYLKDRLMIFCESSTWELVYTGNEVLPFRFQQLNIELGVESQNSIIPFDKQILGFGSTGVHACNGMNMQRIDEQIPYTIFSILNSNDGPERVQGIRDYYSEEAYWSYPDAAVATKFPTTMLVYNYRTNAWAMNSDSITAFGYFQKNDAVIWADLTSTWGNGDEQWADPSDIALFRDIVGGNQQGFVFVMTHTRSTNSLSLSITNITVINNVATITCINHNLLVGQWINIQNVVGLVGINSTVLNYEVNTVTNANVFSIIVSGLTGAYIGGGTISRVDRIFMQSKQYNFFNEIGRRIHTNRIDFLIDTQGNFTPVPPLNNSSIQLDFLTSFSGFNAIVQEGATTGANVGTYNLSMAPQTDQEDTQEKLWRALFPLLEGDVVQFIMYNNPAQMADATQTSRAFALHAMLFHSRQLSDFSY